MELLVVVSLPLDGCHSLSFEAIEVDMTDLLSFSFVVELYV
jgi:hypothetical protein